MQSSRYAMVSPAINAKDNRCFTSWERFSWGTDCMRLSKSCWLMLFSFGEENDDDFFGDASVSGFGSAAGGSVVVVVVFERILCICPPLFGGEGGTLFGGDPITLFGGEGVSEFIEMALTIGNIGSINMTFPSLRPLSRSTVLNSLVISPKSTRRSQDCLVFFLDTPKSSAYES